MNPLLQRINELATAPILLVAGDFDGTLAPIVLHPADAAPDPRAIDALRKLSQLPQTHVAIISGRALADLDARLGQRGAFHLVGSHGLESGDGEADELPSAARSLRQDIERDLRAIADAHPGVRLETKPAGVAMHYRGVEAAVADAAVRAAVNGPAARNGVFVRPGKMVLELTVVDTNKGAAIERLRFKHAASSVIFLGDDKTDEEGFAVLTSADAGFKVGDGETLAQHVIPGVDEVCQLLHDLAAARERFTAQPAEPPIDEHALLSDQRCAAIVSAAGRIVWLCLPRLDSSAIFAELLGGPTGGYFDVAPSGPSAKPDQHYLGDSFILETRWPRLSVIDYLDCARQRPTHRAGRTDLVRVLKGFGKVRVNFAPRLDFGRMPTRLNTVADGLEIEGGADPIVLRSPGVQWRIADDGPHQTAQADVDLGGRPVVFELRYGTGNLDAARFAEPVRREETMRFWEDWSRQLTVPDVASDLVRRSALVLYALVYGPTGAIAAAATTSLPEHVGGVRNWDYRYCWPRDAAMSAAALVRLGATGVAMQLLDWILEILERCPGPQCLSPVYTVIGSNEMTEGEIGVLRGYRNSRPVRIGNLAAHQVQLDVFGPIADLVARLADHGAAVSPEHWRVVEMMVEAVGQRWQEPDHGIWEIRLAKRHHLHSKVMCWMTIDQAMRVASYLGHRRPQWAALRDAIAAEVLERGYNAKRGAFTAAYDVADADAATLTVGLSGLLPPDDPRFVGTIRYVERTLREGPTLRRYRASDGLPGPEGGFNLCTCWLIEAYVLTGRRDDALSLFEDYIAAAGPTGLFSEERDPHTGEALGNFPQAYSHLGLINAALRIDEAGWG
jgi:trehalose-phosphatase